MARVVLNKAFQFTSSVIHYMRHSTGRILTSQPNGHGSDGQIPQHVIAQTTPTSVVNEDRPETLPDDLKNESKIALALFAVSAACVLLLLGELKSELDNPSVFGVYASLSYISFFSSIIMFLLILYRPNIRCLVKIVRFTMYVSLGSLLYASVSAYFARVL
ncbi:hypothetical protein MKW94_019669 [Papaver nudicaule]|uniref:Uncharacterized protein n=1 Tax=Papaver nudicaule TaxID=74823 RepID=A0AA41S0M9_PAPNU|nr:hypothetical protein [Papaver nudicaule]